MKKKSFATICVAAVMFIIGTIFLASCGSGEDTSPVDTELGEYTIQYADDSGAHTITVTDGMPYSLDAVPAKTGYDFMGLYDAAVGGTQYVSANGSSLAPFTDKKNMVLFPQFKAKEYTLVLDYQGAAVTGSRSMKVAYDSEIGDLPLNLTLENKNFVGWYTQPDKQGVQVADRYGVLPENSKVTEKLFDLSDPDGIIKLYAGFKGEEFTVTFYFTESGAPEEVKVEYGTPISEVQLETRVDGKSVLVWSKKRNDTNKEQAFTGKVTSEMVLYAAEFAPVIDFDSNGGNNINSIIARAGDAINLPTPIRENYKFVGWQDGSGSTFNSTTMPENSSKLVAKWQAMIIFDTNGGTEVESISEPQGTKITLPETEKAGYMFAGWYDANGKQYSNITMSSISIHLQAKWYMSKSKNIVFLKDGEYSTVFDTKEPKMVSDYNIVLADEISDIDWTKNNNIKISFFVSIQHASYYSGYEDYLYATKEHFYFYSNSSPSDAYLLNKTVLDHGKGNVEQNFVNLSFELNFNTNGGTIYVAFGADKTVHKNWTYIGWRMTNYYCVVSYPDMSTLY